MTPSDHLSHLPRPLLCSMHRQLGPRELTSLGLSSATRSSLFTFLLLLPVFLFRRVPTRRKICFLEKVKTNPELILNILEKRSIFRSFRDLSKNLGIEISARRIDTGFFLICIGKSLLPHSDRGD